MPRLAAGEVGFAGIVLGMQGAVRVDADVTTVVEVWSASSFTFGLSAAARLTRRIWENESTSAVSTRVNVRLHVLAGGRGRTMS